LTLLVKEAYDSELERMNNGMSAENQSLQYDNKQLNALIKEYEQTLETLMTTFRNQAVS
jgi:prefoldin subunit 5